MSAAEQRKRRSEFLGMDVGTASNKLRGMIMFDLISRLGENTCYVCDEEIIGPGELSIEHKKPWEHRDATLFWDLDNIAFSHRKCNRPHNHVADRIRKVGPEGTAWCYRCQDFLTIDNFQKSSKRWNGFRSGCRKCSTELRLDLRKRTGRR